MAAGVVTGDFMLRLPLDDFWPDFHLAPYFFAGLGGIFIGSPGERHRDVVERTFFVTKTEGAPATQPVTFTGRRMSGIQEDFPGGSQVLGHFGVDSNIGLLLISGFSVKLVMTSSICHPTTLFRPILVSDSPSNLK